MSIQASLQRSFSRGLLTVSSGNILDAPIIDPRYLSHDGDIQILREAFKCASASTLWRLSSLTSAQSSVASPRRRHWPRLSTASFRLATRRSVTVRGGLAMP